MEEEQAPNNSPKVIAGRVYEHFVTQQKKFERFLDRSATGRQWRLAMQDLRYSAMRTVVDTPGYWALKEKSRALWGTESYLPDEPEKIADATIVAVDTQRVPAPTEARPHAKKRVIELIPQEAQDIGHTDIIVCPGLPAADRTVYDSRKIKQYLSSSVYVIEQALDKAIKEQSSQIFPENNAPDIRYVCPVYNRTSTDDVMKGFFRRNQDPEYYDPETIDDFVQEFFLPRIAKNISRAEGGVWEAERFSEGEMDDLYKNLRLNFASISAGGSWLWQVTTALQGYMGVLGYNDEEIQQGMDQMLALNIAPIGNLNQSVMTAKEMHIVSLKDWIVMKNSDLEPLRVRREQQLEDGHDGDDIYVSDRQHFHWVENMPPDITYDEQGQKIDTMRGHHGRLYVPHIPDSYIRAFTIGVHTEAMLPDLDSLMDREKEEPLQWEAYTFGHNVRHRLSQATGYLRDSLSR